MFAPVYCTDVREVGTEFIMGLKGVSAMVASFP